MAKPIESMTLKEKKNDAFKFLCSLVDIEDHVSKLGKEPRGYLRTATISQLSYLYTLGTTVAEEVIDTYIEHATKWQENIDLAKGGANATNN